MAPDHSDNPAATQPAPRLRTVCVVSVGGTDGRGGMSRLVRYQADAWEPQSGYRLWVVDSYGPAMRFSTMPFHFLYAFIRVVLRNRRVDLFHVHMATHGSTVREGAFVWLARLSRRPVVLHLHGSAFAAFDDQLPGPGRRLLRRLLAGTDRLIVIGETLRREASDRFGVPGDRIDIVPNAVPDATEAGKAGPPARCRIVYLGRLEAAKGTADLIEALANPALRPLAWDAVLAGPGPLDPWRAAFSRRGLADRVHVLGWQDLDEVRRLLADADIFVLPSHGEVQSMAVLEAMAAGCAVVATPVGAVPDAVIDNESGLIVGVGDPAALATAIRRLVEDRDLRLRLGAGARRRQRELFGIEKHCANLVRVYDAVVSGGGSASVGAVGGNDGARRP